MKLYFHETEIGRIGIAEESGSITNVYFERDAAPQDVEICETETIKEAFRQLDAYLAGDLKEFSLPLDPRGTDFMRRVWKLLCEIPYGRTASYKDIAAASGDPNAARAVGMANNRNPIPIFIPCHRVIGRSGKLTGYRGGLGLKKKLLELEEKR
ncbi:MAG TPA: methylated-DNA--[protein]-cysteine S-methyltransferase [Armatimonadota bacterium]|jgi:methylated-DNA-[protein]-cysteine S-methyltransferase